MKPRTKVTSFRTQSKFVVKMKLCPKCTHLLP